MTNFEKFIASPAERSDEKINFGDAFGSAKFIANGLPARHDVSAGLY